AIAAVSRLIGGRDALPRHGDIGAVSNARSATGQSEFTMRRDDARIEEIDMHTAPPGAEVELRIESVRSLAAVPLIDAIQAPTVGASQLGIPALNGLRGDRIVAVGLREARGREATGQSARLAHPILLDVGDPRQRRQLLGLAWRGVHQKDAEMAE